MENSNKEMMAGAIINKYMKKFLMDYNKLEPIVYNGNTLNYKSCHAFTISTKDKNDSFNKERENVIVCILNNKIPMDYYKYSFIWGKLRQQLLLWVIKSCKEHNIYKINSIECITAAGRSNHNDFNLKINDHIIKVEFKFNAVCVNEAPQFCSPMNPSQFLDRSFSEYFYDNHLPSISNYGNIELPNKEEYLRTINSNIVPCMSKYKAKYDTDAVFNKYCKRIDKSAIKQFISMANIDIVKLSNYLVKSQDKKEYMLYKDGECYYEKLDEGLFKIKEIIGRQNTNFIAITESGMKLEIKLRFKNGCGLQFPAFQIKRKIPYIKELKLICKHNNITSPKLKKDICKILDKLKIVY